MQVIFEDCLIKDYPTGMSFPKDANVISRRTAFDNVGTCVEIRDDTSINSKDVSTIPNLNSSSRETEDRLRSAVKTLHNFEIVAKKNKDKAALKKIRDLKNNAGSKNFFDAYSLLKEEMEKLSQ
ncbi:hypothetical protein ACOUKA_13175 [Acinetobacter baumannii]